MIDVNYFEQFSSCLNSVPVLGDSTKRLFYLLSAYPQHMNAVYESIFEGSIPQRLRQEIAGYCNTVEEMRSERWKSILSCLDNGNLAKLTVDDTQSFLQNNPRIKKMVNVLHSVKKQGEILKGKWGPLDMAKAYLTLYQPNFEELWQEVMPSSRYDSISALQVFRGDSEMDAETLSKIAETIV